MNKWTRPFEGKHASAEPAGPAPAPAAHHYFAFLSYSHEDSADADWLHKELERFRVPSSLAGRLTENGVVPRRLTPIFRDQHELAASEDLGAEIRQALANSRSLIVLCSPAAAKSKWTNAEIDTFKRLHPDGCIVAAVIAGEPLASDIPGREEEECFPPALVAKYNRRGKPTGQKSEPLAADLREGKGGRRTGFLKVVAGILGVGLDELVQREQLRRQRRLATIAGGSLGGMLIASVLAVTAYDARNEARDQRQAAESLVGFMLGDLREKLEPIGRLDALDAVGSRALQYYENQDKSDLSDEALAQRARALTLMGEIANTRGDLDTALRLYREAFATTAEDVSRHPDDPQRLFDHAQNVFWVGYIAYQRGQLGEADSRFREYERLGNAMVALEPGNKTYRREIGYANTNLGTVLEEQRRFREAATKYRTALSVAESLAASEPRNRDYQFWLSNNLAWLADAQEFSGELEQALATRERQLRLLADMLRLSPRDVEIQRHLMTTRRSIGRLLVFRGDSAAGLRELLASVAISDELFRIEPDNTEWLQANAAGRFDLADVQLASGRTADAAATVRSGCDLVDRLMRRDKSVTDWKVDKRAWCLNVRARLALAEGSATQAIQLAKESVVVAGTAPEAIDRAILSFRALAIGGNALAAAGDHRQALRWWRSAASKIPASIGLKPREQADLAAVQLRLGNKAQAQRLISQLEAIGYREPAYLNAIKQTGAAA